MPTVSVIIPAYNASLYLAYTLESVLQQTWPDWELCVVDDGSTDSTRVLVESYMPVFGSRLRYLYQPNSGISKARNTGIVNSTGAIIAMVDADDVWLPHHLERGLECFDRYPEVGLVHAAVDHINAAGEIIGKPPRPAARHLSGHIARDIYTRRAHVLAPTVMFRRKCLDEVGIFDESMVRVEDRDLCFRIAERFEVRYLPDIHAHYRVTATSASRNREVVQTYQALFLVKHRQRGACSRLDFHRALGNLLRERGDDEFREGRLRAALGLYGGSVLQYPASVRNVYMLARALAEPALARIRSVVANPA